MILNSAYATLAAAISRSIYIDDLIRMCIVSALFDSEDIT